LGQNGLVDDLIKKYENEKFLGWNLLLNLVTDSEEMIRDVSMTKLWYNEYGSASLL
jgi:hypothetical protein